MYLDLKNWKEFEIGDYFKKIKIKKLTVIPKNNGYIDIPVISSQSTNNGVASFVKSSEFKDYIIYKKCISISTNGSCFECFYQNKPFIINSDVEVIWNEYLENENIAIFLITILSKQKEKYSYGMKNKGNKILLTKIPLPVNQDGNPDWKFMEDYIKSLKNRERESNELIQSLINNHYGLNFSNWKEFSIGDFFDVKRGKRIVKNFDYTSEKTNKNIYPTITTTMNNNGIDGYYHKYNCEGRVIICCGEVSGMYSTYHDEKCWALDTTRILTPKYDFLNKYNAFFLITIFNQNMVKFSYGLKAKPEDIKNTIISLPTNKNGNPDWKFMEYYIKSLSFSKYL